MTRAYHQGRPSSVTAGTSCAYTVTDPSVTSPVAFYAPARQKNQLAIANPGYSHLSGPP